MKPRTRKVGKASTWSHSPSLVERLRVVAVMFDDQFPTEVASRPKAKRKSKPSAYAGSASDAA
jgi:hypothetical protein